MRITSFNLHHLVEYNLAIYVNFMDVSVGGSLIGQNLGWQHERFDAKLGRLNNWRVKSTFIAALPLKKKL